MSVELKQKKNSRQGLWLLLIFAAVVRLALVLLTDGYESDVACFSSWAFRMAENGPSGFYAPDYFADYPPAYMLVLGFFGKIAQFLGIPYGSKALEVLLSIVPIGCDLGLAFLMWQIGTRNFGPKAGGTFAAFAAFCPPLLYDTGVWKQVDGVLCFLMVLCFWLLSRRRFMWGAAVFGLALAIKPQPLLLGPVLAICFLQEVFRQKDARSFGKAVGTCFAGLFVSLGVVLFCALPYGFSQGFGWLVEKYTGTVSSYPYGSINGFNLIALLGGNWQQQTDLAFGLISWQALGTVGIAVSSLCLIWLAVRGMRNGRFCPLLLAAFYGVAVFTLAHRMHERYILPAVLLTLAAAARWGDRRLLGSFWLLSLSSLLNQAVVLLSNGTDDQFLTSELSRFMIFVVGMMTLVGMLLLFWTALAITGSEKVHVIEQQPKLAQQAQPVWTGRELVFLAALTLGTAVLSLWQLGDFTAPQNPLDAIGTEKSEQLVLEEAADSFWVYTGVTWDGTAVLTDQNGAERARMELDTQDGFKWKQLEVTGLEPGTYTLTLNNNQLQEVAFFSADGTLAAANGNGALLDEQLQVPKTFSYKNSTYFDEIYHGRTAYEHLHGMPVYETTHPPLGKVFIMLGIALFGMTGFGWRISGALFGVALVPVLYLFVRRLTRSRFGAGVAAVLCALDGMRFAQSRISTIDIYGTFFILLAAYFMVWYCQSVLEKGVGGSILPMALAGIAFGLGAASKWTGIYAGAGLAVIYFAVLWQRWKQQKPGFKRELVIALAGGVGFFVILPLCIYIAAYLPYWWREGGFSLSEWWRCQETMLSYHSHLAATHPYESRWYSWPFAARPVWYYLGAGLPEGMRATISGMGNPLVWWISSISIGMVFWRQLSGRQSTQGGAVMVFYLAQLLPWVIVARSTFMYHYFPSLMFALAAIGLVFAQWEKKNAKAARRTAIVVILMALVVFVLFYPVFSGTAVSSVWIKKLRWLKSWVF